MLRMLRKNIKGFTLVEVIVVAVIVAVLALVAIQLYQGYVREARQNTAENLAASAAHFCQAAINASANFTAGGIFIPASLVGGGTWSVTFPNSLEVATFTCPLNAFITVTDPNLTATVGGTIANGGKASKAYPYKLP